MRIDLNARAAINLDKDAFIKLPRSLGDTIICTRGILWVTEDYLPQDNLLRAGDRYVSKGTGALFVNALDPSAFRVAPNEAANGWVARVAHQIAWTWRAPCRETLVPR